MLELIPRIKARSLVTHGTEDAIRTCGSGAARAELLNGQLATLGGSGHCPQVRDPVRVNLMLRDFIKPRRTSAWTRAMARPRRALYISSPTGLGHAQRDLAIA